MKGIIACCLADLVCEKFGKDKWDVIMKKSGINPSKKFLAMEDVPDDAVMKVVQNTCDTLGINLQQAADAFGEYWVNTFAIKIYKAYYSGKKTAKDFLVNMDFVHKTVTQNMENAHPPRFEYEWKNDKTLIMHYKSTRGLIDFLVGLIKGVGKYFKENLTVTKIGSNKVEILFP